MKTKKLTVLGAPNKNITGLGEDAKTIQELVDSGSIRFPALMKLLAIVIKFFCQLENVADGWHRLRLQAAENGLLVLGQVAAKL